MSHLIRKYRPGFIARFFSLAGWMLTLGTPASGRIKLNGPAEAELGCLDVVSVTSTKAWFWNTVEIHSHARVDTLPGLSKRAAESLTADLVAFVNGHLSEVIGSEVGRLREVDARLQLCKDGAGQYLSHADLTNAVRGASEKAAGAMEHPLFDPDLMPMERKSTYPWSFQMFINPTNRQDHNERFVVSEKMQLDAFFDDLDGRSLSDQQREACIRMEDNNLLVASAGSGKSAAIVGKVAYVAEKKLYRPEEILVLAFNKSAADELKERIAAQMCVEQKALKTKVTTFHALGRSIIQEVEGRPPQLANWVSHPAGEAKAIEEIIQELIGSDPKFKSMWIDLLVLHPRAERTTAEFDSEVDFERFIAERRRKGAATIQSLAGVHVKSQQELRIANWLWINSVDFEYEKQISIQAADGQTSHFHPDFYYPLTDTIHEHFAINADGTSPFDGYIEHADGKRAAYHEAGWDFFETTSAQSRNETLIEALKTELERRNIPLVKREYEEIKKALQPMVIKHYHQLVGACIKHIRASHITLEQLLTRAETLQDTARAKLFARVVWTITTAYTEKLEAANRIDFDAMIGDATQHIESGAFQSPYSLILVDEFQDISVPRANLIQALKQQNPQTKLFAVGDDWQSIYRFAGSDVSLFTDFEKNFGSGWIGRLERTYRCNQLIAMTAAEFVQRNPDQISKSVQSSRPSIPKSIRVVPNKGKSGQLDFSKPCLHLLVRLDAFLARVTEQWQDIAGGKLKVMVLWRYNQLDPFQGNWPVFEHIEVVGLSFHRSKGLEADYTILLDVSEGDYGVPSQIEDDELLNLVIPHPETYPFAEERRLFYVALTRASRGVFILTNEREPSRFIKELCEVADDDIRFETLDGEAMHQCPACLVGQMVERRSKSGHNFLGCNQYPDCSYTE